MVSKHTLSTSLYILTILVITQIYGQNSTVDIERMSFLLDIFCPGDGICMSNRSAPEGNPDHKSCCSNCSCHDDCYLTNCCFPQLTNYEEIPEFEKTPELLHRTCLSPYTTEYDETLAFNVNSYYMITSAGSMTLSDIQTTTMSMISMQRMSQRPLFSEPLASSEEICGDQIVAPWGSLYPVYSKEKDLIFKNSVCAEAYNVTDGILWNPFLICQSHLSNYNFLIDGVTFDMDMDIKNWPKDCFVYLQPPVKDVDSHICYTEEHAINTCPETNDEIALAPPYDVYTDEIKSACTSGLVLPIRQSKLYANVFCAICNQLFYKSAENCPRTEQVWEARFGKLKFGFVGRLDADVLFLDKEEKLKPRLACGTLEDVTNGICKKVHCPSGKLPDKDGNCQSLTKLWYIYEYHIMVNISSKHGIDSSVFENDASALINVWPQNWYVVQILKEVQHMDKNIVPNLIVNFRLKSYKGDDPTQLMLDVKTVMEQNWGLNIDDKFHQLEASFGKFREFFTQDSQNEMVFSHSANISEVVPKPTYVPIYKNPYRSPVDRSWFYITKLFFCEQVELEPDEFALNEGRDIHILYNKLTGQYLHDGEFTLFYKGDELVARICLDALGLVVKSAGTKIIAASFVWVTLGLASGIGIWNTLTMLLEVLCLCQKHI